MSPHHPQQPAAPPSPKSSPRCARSARPSCQSSSRWLDELDETGRWALLKLVTGAMRIGISARLAKTAARALGDKDPHEIELMWPGLSPPYLDLFAWLEGRAEKPVNRDPAPFRR
jgi:DNA ligase-1